MPPTQLLVFDLDGTLLDSSHRVPPGVRDLLFAFREKGIETTLATGRPFAAVKDYIQELELQLPFIVFNGAVVSTPGGQPLSIRPLPLASARTILGLLAETPAANQLYLHPSDNFFYSDRQGEAAEHITQKDGVACRQVRSLLDVLNDTDRDPVKMFSVGARDELEQVKAAIQRIEPDVTCVFSEHDMLEVLGPEVNKGTALSVLCDEVGIDRESVIAFGDNMNDFEMLQEAGLGVAMSTGPVALQETADRVISDMSAFLREHLVAVQSLEVS